jgi:hypothetical protein
MTGNTAIGMGQSRPLNEKAITTLNDESSAHPHLDVPDAARFSTEQMQLLRADLGASGDTLDSIYNPEGDGEHPVISRAMWREAVVLQDTISGYWDWTAHRIAVLTSDADQAVRTAIRHMTLSND